MKRFDRWVAANAWAVYIVAIFLDMVITFAICIYLQWDSLVLKILWPITWYLIACWVFSRSDVLLREAVRPLWDACDPNPLLEETRRQLGYPGLKNKKLVCQCSYALALQLTGRFEEALDILTQIPLHKTFGVSAHFKTVYYNNLMSLYMQMNQFDRAEEAYPKMLQYYRKIKIPWQRRQMQYIVESKKSSIPFADRNMLRSWLPIRHDL